MYFVFFCWLLICNGSGSITSVGEERANRPDLESAIFETCMISTFILPSFQS